MGSKTIVLNYHLFFCFDRSFFVNQIGPGKGFDIVDFKENKKVSAIQKQVEINPRKSITVYS